jgi:hypothetical protein
MHGSELRSFMKQKALEAGFDISGITSPDNCSEKETSISRCPIGDHVRH